MNRLHFEIKRSKIGVTARPNIVKNALDNALLWQSHASGQYDVKDRLVLYCTDCTVVHEK